MKKIKSQARKKHFHMLVMKGIVMFSIYLFGYFYWFKPLISKSSKKASGVFILVLLGILFFLIFLLYRYYEDRYKIAPTGFEITDKELIINYIDEKEKIGWENIRDCSPRKPWVIRTFEGEDYHLDVVENEIIKEIYEIWQKKSSRTENKN